MLVTGGPPVRGGERSDFSRRMFLLMGVGSVPFLRRRGWLKPENRCLVPVNSFAEYAPEPNPETKKKDVVWFALNEDRPLAAFAGI
jgi:hypothetical protein